MQDRVEIQAMAHFTIQCLSYVRLPMAWADEHRVQQVLENLLENAIKYSPEGGVIELLVYPTDRSLAWEDNIIDTTEEQGASQISITVRDHGIGIPQWQQSMVFEPFLRLPQSASRQISGVGLGLYIARKLIEAMHGTITLKSSSGQGTSITLTLPIATAATSIATAQSTTDKVLL
ncbi:sensor histidine kinase [Dictyobacter kobayashii]|nr:ATP-binding protein [Dictyobacter kobayashii]